MKKIIMGFLAVACLIAVPVLTYTTRAPTDGFIGTMVVALIYFLLLFFCLGLLSILLEFASVVGASWQRAVKRSER